MKVTHENFRSLSSSFYIPFLLQTKQNNRSDSVLESIKNWCVAWWHSGQEEDSFEDIGDWCDYECEQSYADYATSSTVETPVASSVSR